MRTRRISLPRIFVCSTLTLVLLLAFRFGAQTYLNYKTKDDGTIIILPDGCFGGAVTIPDTINGLPVTSIADRAFTWCAALTSVAIPNSVTRIGDSAFSGCTGLTSVTIPDSVTSIEAWAFSGCTGLTEVAIPDSVTSIGNRTFYGCSGLTSITIPDGVTSIGDYAFLFCDSPNGAYFEGNAPSVASDAFSQDHAIIFYLPGTKGWGTAFGGHPTAQWLRPSPTILTVALGFGIQTNQFGFTISWATNAAVLVEAVTNLAKPTWSPISTNTLAGGTSYFSDPEWAKYPSRFYRVRAQRGVTLSTTHAPCTPLSNNENLIRSYGLPIPVKPIPKRSRWGQHVLRCA